MGWEAAASYQYLREDLPRVVGPITWLRREIDIEPDLAPLVAKYEDRLGHYSAMVRRVLKYANMPSGAQRWCTTKLKLAPARRYFLSRSFEPVNVVGIRAQESHKRATMTEHDWSAKLDAPVWRPIIAWTLDDVIAIHQRHNVSPNPLYFSGQTRVGCWPCIFARKSEIRSLAELDPGRVELIAELERDVQQLRDQRALTEAGKWKHSAAAACDAAWFKARLGSGGTWPIARVVEWSRTARGGRQFELFASAPRDSGCVRWGMCDVGSDK